MFLKESQNISDLYDLFLTKRTEFAQLLGVDEGLITIPNMNAEVVLQKFKGNTQLNNIKKVLDATKSAIEKQFGIRPESVSIETILLGMLNEKFKIGARSLEEITNLQDVVSLLLEDTGFINNYLTQMQNILKKEDMVFQVIDGIEKEFNITIDIKEVASWFNTAPVGISYLKMSPEKLYGTIISIPGIWARINKIIATSFIKIISTELSEQGIDVTIKILDITPKNIRHFFNSIQKIKDIISLVNNGEIDISLEVNLVPLEGWPTTITTFEDFVNFYNNIKEYKKDLKEVQTKKREEQEKVIKEKEKAEKGEELKKQKEKEEKEKAEKFKEEEKEKKEKEQFTTFESEFINSSYSLIKNITSSGSIYDLIDKIKPYTEKSDTLFKLFTILQSISDNITSLNTIESAISKAKKEVLQYHRQYYLEKMNDIKKEVEDNLAGLELFFEQLGKPLDKEYNLKNIIYSDIDNLQKKIEGLGGGQ